MENYRPNPGRTTNGANPSGMKVWVIQPGKNHDQLRSQLRTKGIWSGWWKKVVINTSYEEGPDINTWIHYAYCFLIPFWISLSTTYTYLHQYEKKTGETNFAVDVGPSCWLSEHLGILKMNTLSLHCHSFSHRLVQNHKTVGDGAEFESIISIAGLMPCVHSYL